MTEISKTHSPVPETSEKEKAFSLCKTFLGGAWKQISCNEMEFWQISGGTVNKLYFCGLPTKSKINKTEPKSVLMRLFGANIQEGEDKAGEENVIFSLLAQKNLGPKLYGIFQGGRLEEYIFAPTLKRSQIKDPNISMLIAQKLAQVHAIDAPVSKEPHWILKNMKLWNTKLIAMIKTPTINEDDSVKFSQLQSYKLDEEWEWLQPIIKQSKSPVVFSHNDLSEANILYKADASSAKEKLTFIDFEFCSYNYRAFDIANHFAETLYDYEREDEPYYYYYPEAYPTIEEQLYFIRAYLSARQQLAAGKNEIKLEAISKTPVTTDEEKDMLFECDCFLLVSDYLWGIWAILNSQFKMKFGFWAYGECRLENYFKTKEKLLNNAKFMELIHNIEKN